MGRRGYPPEFRRRVLDLLASGRRVTDLARDLRVSSQTIYIWRTQDLDRSRPRPRPDLGRTD
jgi:transposase-like protein